MVRDPLFAICNRGLHGVEAGREFAEFIVRADVDTAVVVTRDHALRGLGQSAQRTCNSCREPGRCESNQDQECRGEYEKPAARFDIGLHRLAHRALQYDIYRVLAGDKGRLDGQQLIPVSAGHVDLSGFLAEIDMFGVRTARRNDRIEIASAVDDRDTHPGQAGNAVSEFVVNRKTEYDPADRNRCTQRYCEQVIGGVGKHGGRLSGTAAGIGNELPNIDTIPD